MGTPTAVRTAEDATIAIVIFISGIAGFTNEPELAGSGASSWVGTGKGAWTIHHGLHVPRSLPTGLSLESGMLENREATFEITDIEGNVMSPLLATERSSQVETLEEWIRPGHNHTGNSDGPASLIKDLSSVNVSGGQVQDLADKHVGLELFGPSRERNYLRPWPVSYPTLQYGQGMDHPVNQDDPGGLMPPVWVSDDPVVFTGRLVTLWIIYKNPTLNAGDYTDWYPWDPDDIHYWHGHLTDNGAVRLDSKKWSLKAEGPSALLERTINQHSTSQWFAASAEAVLEGTAGLEEDRVGVQFMDFATFNTALNKTYRSCIFDIQANLSNATDTTKGELINWLQTVIDSVKDGDGASPYVNEAFDNIDFVVDGGAGNDLGHAFGLSDTGIFTIRREESGSGGRTAWAYITLHEKVWKILGYEPTVQGSLDASDPRRASFVQRQIGDVYGDGTTQTIPAQGYWMARFSTRKLGLDFTIDGAEDDAPFWDNDGAPREWHPMYTGGTSVFDVHGNQEIGLSPAPSGIIIEPQHARPSMDVQIDGSDVLDNGVRYMLFRGDVFRPSEGDAEPHTIYQVAKCSMRQQNGYGTVYHDGSQIKMYLERWLDPMAFGLPYEPLVNDWVSPEGAEARDARVNVRPLAVFTNRSDNLAMPLHTLPLRIMLTSGTSTGWDGNEDAPGVLLDRGENTHGENANGLDRDADDVEIADLGLAIPSEICQAPRVWRREYEKVAMLSSPIFKGQLVLDRATNTREILMGLLKPYNMAISLHGGKYGVVRLGPVEQGDVDVTLTAADYNSPLPPRQELRALGPIDNIVLEHRYNPEEEGLSEVWEQRALDPLARYRHGKTTTTIRAPALLAPSQFRKRTDFKSIESVTGATDWGPELQDLLAREVAEWRAKRHFAILNVRVSRPKGQDIRPGTRVRITEPWVVSTDGEGTDGNGYGVTEVTGLVYRVKPKFATRSEFLCDILVGAENFQGDTGGRYIAALGRVTEIDDTAKTILLAENPLGHEDTDLLETAGFEPPAWDNDGGNVIIRLWHHNRMTWVKSQTVTLASVSSSTRVLTYTGSLSSSYIQRNMITYAAIDSYDNQAADSWPTTHYGVICLDTTKFGTGPTQAWPLQ